MSVLARGLSGLRFAIGNFVLEGRELLGKGVMLPSDLLDKIRDCKSDD